MSSSNLFISYPSIENHYNEKHMEHVKNEISENTIFFITEKVDGSNFSIIGTKLEDGSKSVVFGKRTSLIDPKKNDYFDFDSIEKDLIEKMHALLDKYTENQTITVFGELLGGHKSFNTKPTCKMIGPTPYTHQRGFLAFDLLLDGVFQDWSHVVHSGFPTVPYLGSGTLEECLQFDVENYKSKVPHLYGHDVEVIAEGVVIKPYKPIFLPNHSRVIFKKKHPNFMDCRKTINTKKLKKIAGENDSMSGKKVNEMMEFLKPYVIEHRIHSVLSKEPSLENEEKMKPRFLGLVVKDVYETFERDHEGEACLDVWKALNKTEKKMLETMLKKEWKKCFPERF